MKTIKKVFSFMVILSMFILAYNDDNSSNSINNIDLNISNLIIDDGSGVLNNRDTEIPSKDLEK